MKNPFLATAIVAASAMMLSACQAPTSSTESSVSSSVSVATVGTASGASATPTSTVSSTMSATATPSATASATVGPSGGVPTVVLPSATGAATTTPAGRAAWEALLSADGEYEAYAAYQAVIAQFGEVEPYANLRDAEQNHVNALKRQLARLGVTAPDNPYLGRVAVPATLKEAAQDRIDSEQRNIAMYDQLMSPASGDAVLTEVFVNLRDASQNQHLPALQRALAKA